MADYDLLWGDIKDEDIPIDIEDLILMKPLHKYRSGILKVSDLSQQLWCEHKLFLSLISPKYFEKPVYVSTGISLHLSRELAVQDIKEIKIATAEDCFGVKAFNLLLSTKDLLHSSTVRREVPVFGIPLDCNVFMMGIIDELRCDTDTFNIDLIEFKTRRNKTLPCAAQKETYKLQIMLYKSLLDNLFNNKLSKESISYFLNLDMKMSFGKDLIDELKVHKYHFCNLDGLLDELFMMMQSLPNVTNLLIDYCYQQDAQTFQMESILYDEVWLKEKLNHLLQFWEGERTAKGVEIKEAWKCQYCEYADNCTWRKQKATEYQSIN